MGERTDFDGETGRIGAVFSRLREEAGQSEAMFLRIEQERRLPRGEEIVAEDDRRQRLLSGWAEADDDLSRQVRALSAALGQIRFGFDTRELPGRLDGLLGLVSKSALRLRQTRRFRKRVDPAHMSRLLVVADRLQGLIVEERDFALERRRILENARSGIVRQRAALLGAPGSGTGAMAHIEAVAAIEGVVHKLVALGDLINGHIGNLNAILHKLWLDTEELLILYRALAEIDGEGGRPLPADGALPSLAAAIERYGRNRLVAPDAGRRRKVVDHGFVERFARPQDEAPADQPVEGIVSRLVSRLRVLRRP